MPEYIFTCPICRKRYKLTPNNPSTLAQKTFTCPNCRYTAPFPSLIKDFASPLPDLAVSGGNSASPTNPGQHIPTKVSPTNGQKANAFITVVGSNARFVLSQGAYILGRKSSDSTATLQLAPDICMSRQHARLALQSVGGKLMAQMMGLKPNNPVVVNGKPLAAGKPCTLKPGDRIQMGTTIMIFTI